MLQLATMFNYCCQKISIHPDEKPHTGEQIICIFALNFKYKNPIIYNQNSSGKLNIFKIHNYVLLLSIRHTINFSFEAYCTISDNEVCTASGLHLNSCQNMINQSEFFC